MRDTNPILKKFLKILRKGLTIGVIVAIVLIDLIISTVDGITITEKILTMFACDILYIFIQLMLYYIVYFILMKED